MYNLAPLRKTISKSDLDRNINLLEDYFKFCKKELDRNKRDFDKLQSYVKAEKSRLYKSTGMMKRNFPGTKESRNATRVERIVEKGFTY